MTFRFAEVRGTAADHASWWTFHDEDEVRERWWNPQPGDTVLDIGAAFGSYALPALARGARCVCFSPADLDTELLQKNLSLNPELEARCLVVRDGLYSSEGWFYPDNCTFVPDGQEGAKAQELFGMVGNRADGGAGTEKGSRLHTTTLDAFLASRPGIGRVDWLKMDVEGAELEVLKGAEKCLRSDRPRILVENHEQHIPGIGDQVRDYLVGLGVGYICQGPVPYGVVSHSYFEAPR